MCPACITTAAVIAAGTTSGVGVVALVAGKWRGVKRRFRGLRARRASTKS